MKNDKKILHNHKIQQILKKNQFHLQIKYQKTFHQRIFLQVQKKAKNNCFKFKLINISSKEQESHKFKETHSLLIVAAPTQSISKPDPEPEIPHQETENNNKKDSVPIINNTKETPNLEHKNNSKQNEPQKVLFDSKDKDKKENSSQLTQQKLAQIHAATESVNDKEPHKDKKHRKHRHKTSENNNTTIVLAPSQSTLTSPQTKQNEQQENKKSSEISQEVLDDPADDEELPQTPPLSPQHDNFQNNQKKVRKSKSQKEPTKALPSLKVQSFNRQSEIAPSKQGPKFHFSTFVELDAPPTSTFLSQTDINGISSSFVTNDSAALQSTTGRRSGKRFPSKKSFSSRSRMTAPGSPAYVWSGDVSDDEDNFTPRGDGLITSIRLTRYRFLKSKKVIDQDANLRPSSYVVSPDDDDDASTDDEIDDNERNQMMAFSGLADLSHVDRIIKNINTSNPDEYKSTRPSTKPRSQASDTEEPPRQSNCRFVN